MKFTRIMMCALLAMAGFGTNAIAEDTGYVLRVVKYGLVAEDDTAVPPGEGDEDGDDGSSGGAGPGDEPGGDDDTPETFTPRIWTGSATPYVYELGGGEYDDAATVTTTSMYEVRFDPYQLDGPMLLVNAGRMMSGGTAGAPLYADVLNNRVTCSVTRGEPSEWYASWQGMGTTDLTIYEDGWCGFTEWVDGSSFYTVKEGSWVEAAGGIFDPERDAGNYDVTVRWDLDPDGVGWIEDVLTINLSEKGEMTVVGLTRNGSPAGVTGEDEEIPLSPGQLEMTTGALSGTPMPPSISPTSSIAYVSELLAYAADEGYPAVEAYVTVSFGCIATSCADQVLSLTATLMKNGAPVDSHSVPVSLTFGGGEMGSAELELATSDYDFNPDVHPGIYSVHVDPIGLVIKYQVLESAAILPLEATHNGAPLDLM